MRAEVAAALERGERTVRLEHACQARDGRTIGFQTSLTAVTDADGTRRGFVGHSRDVTASKTAEANLGAAHSRLVETAQQIGMMELANGILHDVTDAPISIGASTTLLWQQMRRSRVTSLGRTAELLRQHQQDLPAFLTQDPKGRLLPEYLANLAAALGAEQEATLTELQALAKVVDYAKDLVGQQQCYAQPGAIEPGAMAGLIEDALRLNQRTLEEQRIRVVRQFEAAPAAQAAPSQVLQILMNLLHNARDAVVAAGRPLKQISIRLGTAPGRPETIRLEVCDNGVGIAPEHLARVLEPGFTTKPGGRGFGLAAAVRSAEQMNGRLSADSPGLGKGATFVLELPAAKAEAARAEAAAAEA